MKVFSLLVVLGILFQGSVAQLVDGNFETNSCTSTNPPWCEYNAVQEFCPGWFVLTGNIDVHLSEGGGSGSMIAADGSFFVDLNGDQPGSIGQTVNTYAGAPYQLSFLLSGNCNCGPQVKTFSIFANGGQETPYSFDTTGDTPDSPGWIEQSYFFTADANTNSTSLTFVSTTPASTCGPTLDRLVLSLMCNGTNATANGNSSTNGTIFHCPSNSTNGTSCDLNPATATYHTQSEGDWGDQCSEGFQTGCYRDDQFDSCFPNGLSVGCSCPEKRNGEGCDALFFTSSDAIQNYLPQLGAPAPLDQSYVDPSNPPPISTPAGNFGGQVTALALTLGFESCDATFHTACASVGDLFICDNRCEACRRNTASCRRNTVVNCVFVNARNGDEDDGYADLEYRNNAANNNDGKPQYANCEAFYGQTVSQIFQIASNVLGGCAGCSKRMEDRNDQNCVRNSGCKKNPERNNGSCKRNNGCKKNNNCCCCVDQSSNPYCDATVLNDCIALINQAFIFGKTLNDVASGHLFQSSPCAADSEGSGVSK